jgi:hypothetical protein
VSSLSPPLSRQRIFRGAVLVFAFVLACQAAWLITVEFFRPSSSNFLASVHATDATADSRSAAALAASLGYIRGDLWAEYARTYSDILSGDGRTSVQSAGLIERAREVTNRALGLVPYDAQIWLLLARIDARFDWLNGKSSIALRMSYYTGANETALIASRASLAINSSEIGEPDFQRLVGHDIRIVATRKPELIPAILAAYRTASPVGRQFLETTLKEIDPNLFAKLRSNG